MYIEKIKKLPIYKGYFGIVITNDKKKIKKKHYIRFGGLDIYAHQFTTNHISPDGLSKRLVLFVFNPNREVKLTGAQIAHEAVHGATFIWHLLDIECDMNNDEPFAYLVEYFSDEIMKFFRKHEIKY